MKELLDDLQRTADKLYDKLGATDEVIELQVAINAFRNKYDIPDKKQFTISNLGYAQ